MCSAYSNESELGLLLAFGYFPRSSDDLHLIWSVTSAD